MAALLGEDEILCDNQTYNKKIIFPYESYSQ